MTLEISNLQELLTQIEGVETGLLRRLKFSVDKIDTIWSKTSKILVDQNFMEETSFIKHHNRTPIPITNVSNICFEHQKWGHKAKVSYCRPSCKYGSASMCKKHRIYGNSAYNCKKISPPCQYINLIKDADALQTPLPQRINNSRHRKR